MVRRWRWNNPDLSSSVHQETQTTCTVSDIKRRQGWWPATLVAISGWVGRFRVRTGWSAFLSWSSKLWWYQHNVDEWQRCGLGERRCGTWLCAACCSILISCPRLVISPWSNSKSCVLGWTASFDMVGMMTFITFSANCASSSIGVLSLVEASTIQTFAGRHCKNSSRTNTVSFLTVSPASCCKHRRNWVSFLFPSSSPFSNCWMHCCYDAAVRWMSFSFRLVYWISMGGDKIRLQISVAMSGGNDATTYSNMVRWLVIPRVANSTLTCPNQMFGSDGQNGGSLTATAVTYGWCSFLCLLTY